MMIDLNCDLGELADEPVDELMRSVTSVNIACGGHAGDESTMRRVLDAAKRHGVACGAHPGYEDREHFGRRELQLSGEDIAVLVHRQCHRIGTLAREIGVQIVHVKPHGALYNQAARNPKIAQAIADGVARWRSDVVLVGLAQSIMLQAWIDAGWRVVAEAFADRTYEPDGSLRSRSLPDALHHDPERAVTIARRGLAQTLCIHGDTPGAAGYANTVRRALELAGISVRALPPVSAIDRV